MKKDQAKPKKSSAKGDQQRAMREQRYAEAQARAKQKSEKR